MAGRICLVLNTDDAPGIWLFNRLQETVGINILMVSVDELIHASRFSCGYKNGKPFFSILLQRGLELTHDNIQTFLNRVQYLPVKHLVRFKNEDQGYVNQELSAVFTFLFSIMPNGLFNHSTGMGLNGRQRSQLEWLLLARKAGFDTIEVLYEHQQLQYGGLGAHSNVITVLVFNNKCFGQNLPGDSRLTKYSEALRILSEEEILELYVREVDERFVFLGAALIPTFKSGGDEFLEELKTLL